MNNKWEGYICCNCGKGLISLIFKELIKMEARGERKDYLRQGFNHSWLVLIPKMFLSPQFLPIGVRSVHANCI